MIARRVQSRVAIRGDLAPTSFRAMLQRQALKWGITGWVQPTPEGVYAIFNGREADVDALVRWCERGPLGPRISEVLAERMPREAFSGFDVRAPIELPERTEPPETEH